MTFLWSYIKYLNHYQCLDSLANDIFSKIVLTIKRNPYMRWDQTRSFFGARYLSITVLVLSAINFSVAYKLISHFLSEGICMKILKPMT